MPPLARPPPSQAAPELHTLIPNLAPSDIPELSAYFSESWGNRTRVDYGSGMELNFICWLCVSLPPPPDRIRHSAAGADPTFLGGCAD